MPRTIGRANAIVASLFVPGLGQIFQGRYVAAAVQLVLAVFLWFMLFGWVIHVFSAIEAALFEAPK